MYYTELTDAARIKAALDPGASVRGFMLLGDSADGENLDIAPPRVLTPPPLGVFGLGVEGESTCDPRAPVRPPFCRLEMRYFTPL